MGGNAFQKNIWISTPSCYGNAPKATDGSPFRTASREEAGVPNARRIKDETRLKMLRRWPFPGVVYAFRTFMWTTRPSFSGNAKKGTNGKRHSTLLIRRPGARYRASLQADRDLLLDLYTARLVQARENGSLVMKKDEHHLEARVRL